MESSNVGLIIALFLGAVFGILGLIFLIIALRSRKKAKASQSWPTVPGTVTAASLQENREIDEDGSVSYTYEPVVQYRYAVMGHEYVGSKIAFGANTFGRAQAEQKVNAYPPGAAVTVHYNPDKPEEAVLETQAAGGSVFLIVGIIFLLIALGACCFSGAGLAMGLLGS